MESYESPSYIIHTHRPLRANDTSVSIKNIRDYLTAILTVLPFDDSIFKIISKWFGWLTTEGNWLDLNCSLQCIKTKHQDNCKVNRSNKIWIFECVHLCNGERWVTCVGQGWGRDERGSYRERIQSVGYLSTTCWLSSLATRTPPPPPPPKRLNTSQRTYETTAFICLAYRA